MGSRQFSCWNMALDTPQSTTRNPPNSTSLMFFPSQYLLCLPAIVGQFVFHRFFSFTTSVLFRHVSFRPPLLVHYFVSHLLGSLFLSTVSSLVGLCLCLSSGPCCSPVQNISRGGFTNAKVPDLHVSNMYNLVWQAPA